MTLISQFRYSDAHKKAKMEEEEEEEEVDDDDDDAYYKQYTVRFFF